MQITTNPAGSHCVKFISPPSSLCPESGRSFDVPRDIQVRCASVQASTGVWSCCAPREIKFIGLLFSGMPWHTTRSRKTLRYAVIHTTPTAMQIAGDHSGSWMCSRKSSGGESLLKPARARHGKRNFRQTSSALSSFADPVPQIIPRVYTSSWRVMTRAREQPMKLSRAWHRVELLIRSKEVL